MFKFQPYFALDLETTGLNITDAQILELALVYDDGITPIEQLPHYTTLIKPPLLCIEWDALNLNLDLLKAIVDGPTVGDLERVNFDIRFFIRQCLHCELTDFLPTHTITLAGKNVASFDLPILGNKINSVLLKEWPKIKHRVIDIGSLYMPNFGFVPSLNQINLLLNRPKVAHRALADAYDCIYAIRHKLFLNEEQWVIVPSNHQ